MRVCACACVCVCGTHYTPRPRETTCVQTAQKRRLRYLLTIWSPSVIDDNDDDDDDVDGDDASFFFHVVVSPRHRFSRRVDRFPFRSAARMLICSLLGPLRHRKAPWRTRRKGRISRENPHSKKELTRLMQSGGQSLFIQATSLNISSVFENATRLFIVYPGKSGFFEEPTLGFT